jgi:trehalose 6-phosphate phosphatase
MMQSAPFAQRRPVMVGDDLTDETAMQAALDLGGLAVKVGDGPTLAPVRIADPDALYRWLTRVLT